MCWDFCFYFQSKSKLYTGIFESIDSNNSEQDVMEWSELILLPMLLEFYWVSWRDTWNTQVDKFLLFHIIYQSHQRIYIQPTKPRACQTTTFIMPSPGYLLALSFFILNLLFVSPLFTSPCPPTISHHHLRLTTLRSDSFKFSPYPTLHALNLANVVRLPAFSSSSAVAATPRRCSPSCVTWTRYRTRTAATWSAQEMTSAPAKPLNLNRCLKSVSKREDRQNQVHYRHHQQQIPPHQTALNFNTKQNPPPCQTELPSQPPHSIKKYLLPNRTTSLPSPARAASTNLSSHPPSHASTA